MNLKQITIAGFLLLPAVTLFGQRIKVQSGELDFLKDQKKINIIYDYSQMGVGKFDDEKEYLDKRVVELNEKEAGKGDEWRNNWIADRKNRFEPKFEELFNLQLEKYGVKVGDFDDAAYTLILRTTFTEPGFNVGVVRRNAYTDLEAVFVKGTSNDPLTVISIEKSPGRGGMGFDFDTGYRIQESYAKAGKELGQFLRKKVY